MISRQPGEAGKAAEATKGVTDFPIYAQRQGQGVYHRVLQARAGARYRGARRARSRLPEGNWRRARRLGKRSLAGAPRNSARISLKSSAPALRCWPGMPVAVVDKIVDARGTRTVAEAYLKFLYTKDAQDIIGLFHYRLAAGC